MLIENIKEAFQNLLSNKMRSLLTMLGIIIGISAVITITTIGTSIKSTLNATLNSLGGNSISASVDAIYPEDDADWSNWEYPEMTADDYITQDMLEDGKTTGCSRTATRRMCSSSLRRVLPGLSRMYSRSVSRT